MKTRVSRSDGKKRESGAATPLSVKLQRRYFALAFAVMASTNRLIFIIARFININMYHYDLKLPWDDLVPFLPWTFIIYWYSSAWRVLIYWRMSLRSRKEADRFFTAMLLAHAMAMIIFIIMPTSLVRPEVTGNTLWDDSIRWLYDTDPPENIFPSVHCLLAAMTWIGLRGKKDVNLVFRTVNFLMVAGVYISVLTVRQHVMVDILGGIVVAEVAYLIARSEKVTAPVSRLINKVIYLKLTPEELQEVQLSAVNVELAEKKDGPV